MPEKIETENNLPKILLIDDDEVFTDDLIFLLNVPYEIVAVHESKKGVELLEKEKFDLVILDLMMPAYYAEEGEIEGIEVLKLIRIKWGAENDEKIPAIILTHIDSPGIRKICLELMADAFFTKPPLINSLKKQINKLL